MGAVGTKVTYEGWISRTAEDFARSDEDETTSMGDIEAVAEAYALERGLDSDTVIRDLTSEISRRVASAGMSEAVNINKQFWSNDDIDDALSYIRNNQGVSWKFDNELNKLNPSDARAIRRIINDGTAEDFDRYDSDVSEQFISTYIRLAKGR